MGFGNWPLDVYLDGVTSVVIAAFDRAGRLLQANSGCQALVGPTVEAEALFHRPTFPELMHWAQRPTGPLLYQGPLVLAGRTFRGRVFTGPDGFLLIAEQDAIPRDPRPSVEPSVPIEPEHPLRIVAPQEFADLVMEFARLLDLALNLRGFRVYFNMSDDLRTLAERLSTLNAGPRDLVEVHTEALRQRRQGTTEAKRRVYIEEGRLLLLELMGHTLAHYRRRALAPAPPTGDERG